MGNSAILLALDFKNFVSVTIVSNALKVNIFFKRYALVVFLISLCFYGLPTLDNFLPFPSRKADAYGSECMLPGNKVGLGFHCGMCHTV